jgi:hypothetical protein
MSLSVSKSAANIRSPQLAVEVSPVAQAQSASNKKEDDLGPQELLLLRRFFALLDQWDRQQQP